MKRIGTVGRVAMVAALALLLTGCLKLDMDLQIQSDDTVNGAIVFAVSKDVLELTGGSAEDLLGGETPFPSDVEGVTTEEYDDGEFAGQQFNFDGVPISQFAADPEDPESLSIVREGDTFVVSGALDLSQGLSGATGATGAEQFLESAEIRIAITFPGDVTESNGEVDGNTVSWAPEFGERVDIQATGSAIASGGDSNTLLYVLIGVGAVLLIAIIIIVVVMGRRKKGEPSAMPEGGEMAAAAPTEAAPPVAVPPAPPAAPEPAPPAAPEPVAPEPVAPEPESPVAPETGASEGEGDVPPPPPPAGQP
jgi:hypothetical protein